MNPKGQYTIREARATDRNQLASLIHFDGQVHRHLDYRPPLDWIGFSPFPVLEQNGKITAALACPPDPPEVAWLRLFASAYTTSPQTAWESLWPEAQMQLSQKGGVTWAAAIPLDNWLTAFLNQSNFTCTHFITMLTWENQRVENIPHPRKHNLRPMVLDDLHIVQAIDKASFTPIWHNSLQYLEYAFKQATYATVVEVDGNVIGYQISTATQMGGHLARLAVANQYQGNGIGYALVHDLLTQFERRGAKTISVNTQQDNLSSLALYMKAGFRLTGEAYPIYQYTFGEDQ